MGDNLDVEKRGESKVFCFHLLRKSLFLSREGEGGGLGDFLVSGGA